MSRRKGKERRVVSFYDPGSIINDLFALKTHALQTGRSVQLHGRAGRDARNLFQKTS